MTRRTLLAWLTAPLLAPAVVAAHGGHDHTLLGVITAVTPARLEVQGKDDRVHRIALTAATKITRNGTTLAVRDLAAGDRVVVNVGAVDPNAARRGPTPPLTAKAVQVGVREARK